VVFAEPAPDGRTVYTSAGCSTTRPAAARRPAGLRRRHPARQGPFAVSFPVGLETRPGNRGIRPGQAVGPARPVAPGRQPPPARAAARHRGYRGVGQHAVAAVPGLATAALVRRRQGLVHSRPARTNWWCTHSTWTGAGGVRTDYLAVVGLPPAAVRGRSFEWRVRSRRSGAASRSGWLPADRAGGRGRRQSHLGRAARLG